MKIIVLGVFILMSLSSCAMARTTSGTHYHNNHYQGKNFYGIKKNEYKRLNVGY